jgi:hypothetical protein
VPHVPFASLPDSARLWIFAAERPLTPPERDALLLDVDRFLAQWAAHEVPLTCGRDWRYERFLLVAVDEAAAGVSGCSIDALVRRLREHERQLGIALLDNGPLCSTTRCRPWGRCAAGGGRPRRARLGTGGPSSGRPPTAEVPEFPATTERATTRPAADRLSPAECASIDVRGAARPVVPILEQLVTPGIADVRAARARVGTAVARAGGVSTDENCGAPRTA